MTVKHLIMGTMTLIDMVMTKEMVMGLQVAIKRMFVVLIRILAVIMHVYFYVSVSICFWLWYYVFFFNHSQIATSTNDAV